MLQKLIKYFNTIIYIKPIQAYYQFKYRITRSHINLNNYTSLLNDPLFFLNLKFTKELINSNGKYLGHNQFIFLNITKKFEFQVDWNYDKPGKLWNYNLQYFEFLLDNTIVVKERLRLLKEFNSALLSGKVKAEPYPISIRILNTLLFISENHIRDFDIEEGIKKQLDFLTKNLEYHLLANHLLENYISVYILSLCLNNEALKISFKDKLKAQLNIQILEDGGHYECSPMYHSIILSKVLIALEASIIHNDTDLIYFLREKAEVMSGWLIQYSFPDGTWALMNDSAIEIAPTTNKIIEIIKKLQLEPKLVPLKDSGYKKIVGSNWECIIKIGNIIPSYQPGHTHSDMLSFCIWHKKLGHIVVDPGISTYNINEQRLIERGTLSHNTVAICEKNQSQIWSAFRIAKRGKCRIVSENSNSFTAEVKHFHSKKIHTRDFQFQKDLLIVTDQIKNDYNIDFSSSILLDNKIKYHYESGKISTPYFEIYTTPHGSIQHSKHAIKFNELIDTTRIRITSNNIHTMKFIF